MKDESSFTGKVSSTLQLNNEYGIEALLNDINAIINTV